MIAKHSIEQLKNQIDIVDIISNSLELKKTGANFKACCPFHGEDTPSFVVSGAKQIYHCFGCGVGGDAISFVQEYHKLSYPEALERIANDLNFTLEYDNTQNQKDYKNIIESINHYYINNLKDKELQYLIDRGITMDSIKTFEIGFATGSKEQIEYLKGNFLNIQDAQEIGILSTGDNGLYSRLIERITFPIRNHANKLIGFGGRTITGHSAKYVNTIQTKLFDKSRNLYGLNIAKEHIYKKGTMIITEGYIDVVMMHQASIKTAVATMGTALTEQHIPIIKKMNCKVLLCYDGDKAGRNAAYKASVLLSRHLIDGSAIIFDDGVDPADMVKDGKQKELISLMLHGTPLIQYALSHIVSQFDISNPLKKSKATIESIDFLNSLKNEIVASEYLEYLSYILKTDRQYLKLNEPQQQKTQAPISQISLVELNFIATALESFHALNMIHKYHKKIFIYHKEELEQLLKGEDSLEYITLTEDIITYSDEEFDKQLCIALANYYTKEIDKIKYSNQEPKEKISQIKEMQKKILNYRQGRI
jgi:DNA primase